MKFKAHIWFLISMMISSSALYGGYLLIKKPSAHATLAAICPEGYEEIDEPEEEVGFFEPIGASLGFSCAKAVYHKRMNRYFNDKLEKLVIILQKDNFGEDPNFRPPQIEKAEDLEKVNINGYKEICPPDNVSSYCVSMGALEIYQNYLRTLQNVRQDLPSSQEYNPQNDEARDFWAKYTPLTAIIYGISDRSQQINEEIEIARKTMEATIAAYAEFQTAYPMHREYEKIIKDLIKYKNKLKSMRHDIMLFPGKFIDATSKSCP